MKDIFDKVYCILNLDAEDRINNVTNTFNEYDINNINYIYTFYKPYNNIFESYTSLRTNYYDEIYFNYDNTIYNKVFDCALNHYNIVKSAYKQNLHNILVFEDDIKINVDKQVFDKIIDNIPNDYDIIKFYNLFDEYLPQTNGNNIEFIKMPINKLSLSALMVAYSYNGMKHYIDIVEKNGFAPADIYFKTLINQEDLNVYCLNTCFITNESLPSTLVYNKQQVDVEVWEKIKDK